MTVSDAHAVYARIKSSDRTLDDQELVASAVELLCQDWQRRLRGVGMKGELGAPDWTACELSVWELGEDLRHFLKVVKWRGRGTLLEKLGALAMDPSLGKGRQSLIPLLADWGDGEFGETLGLLVADSEVRGHAIKALTKARIGGHREQVQKVAEETSGWIRQAARKYLSKVDPA